MTEYLNSDIGYLIDKSDKGDVLSQKTLGHIFFHGIGVEKNHLLSEKYYRMAALDGDVESLFELGIMSLFKKDSLEPFYKSKELFSLCFNSRGDAQSNCMLKLLKKGEIDNQIVETLEFEVMYDKLIEEDDTNTFYRGQTSFFGYPLKASMYRYEHSSWPIYYEGGERLRNFGKKYYFENSFKEKVRKSQKIRRLMSRYINNVFGYSFTQSLFQQAGYTSEGLDVSFDLNIALFFSTFDYDTTNGKFFIDENKEYSVIYRWKYIPMKSAFESLHSDYYQSDVGISTYDIFNWFDTCDTIEEFHNSLERYAKEIKWRNGFNLHPIRDRRPFHLIKLPRTMLEKCRVIKQKAGLLLGDCILSQRISEMLDRQGFKPPVHMADLPLRLVQDLSEYPFCEVFQYKRNNLLANKILHEAGIDSVEIYDGNNDDLTHFLLSGWIETVERGSNTLNDSPIPNYGLTHSEMINYLNDMKVNKLKYEYYFE